MTPKTNVSNRRLFINTQDLPSSTSNSSPSSSSNVKTPLSKFFSISSPLSRKNAIPHKNTPVPVYYIISKKSPDEELKHTIPKPSLLISRDIANKLNDNRDIIACNLTRINEVLKISNPNNMEAIFCIDEEKQLYVNAAMSIQNEENLSHILTKNKSNNVSIYLNIIDIVNKDIQVLSRLNDIQPNIRPKSILELDTPEIYKNLTKLSLTDNENEMVISKGAEAKLKRTIGMRRLPPPKLPAPNTPLPPTPINCSTTLRFPLPPTSHPTSHRLTSHSSLPYLREKSTPSSFNLVTPSSYQKMNTKLTRPQTAPNSSNSSFNNFPPRKSSLPAPSQVYLGANNNSSFLDLSNDKSIFDSDDTIKTPSNSPFSRFKKLFGGNK